MSFTDEDLTKLKIRCSYNHSEGYKQTTLKVAQVDAIIKRIEIADALIINLQDPNEEAEEGSLLKAWRKSKGL